MLINCRLTYLMRTNTLICWSFSFDILELKYSIFLFITFIVFIISYDNSFMRSWYARWFSASAIPLCPIKIKDLSPLKQHSQRMVFKYRTSCSCATIDITICIKRILKSSVLSTECTFVLYFFLFFYIEWKILFQNERKKFK